MFFLFQSIQYIPIGDQDKCPFRAIFRIFIYLHSPYLHSPLPPLSSSTVNGRRLLAHCRLMAPKLNSRLLSISIPKQIFCSLETSRMEHDALCAQKISCTRHSLSIILNRASGLPSTLTKLRFQTSAERLSAMVGLPVLDQYPVEVELLFRCSNASNLVVLVQCHRNDICVEDRNTYSGHVITWRMQCAENFTRFGRLSGQGVSFVHPIEKLYIVGTLEQ